MLLSRHAHLAPNAVLYFIRYLFQFRITGLLRFFRELHQFKKALDPAVGLGIWPCLDDRLPETKFDEYYFYQDVWGAKMYSLINPRKILDIGSTALLVGMLSQLTETISLDIRPLPVNVDGLTCEKGSITQIPYDDNSIQYINSLCVIEHIGLGRYGDTIDANGIDKAIAELKRVISPGGHLVLSVPIGPPCIFFNALRIFSREEFIGYFPGFTIIDETFCIPQYSAIDPTPLMRQGEYQIYCVCLQKKFNDISTKEQQTKSHICKRG
jgi:SAM-dependent methyltransferase